MTGSESFLQAPIPVRDHDKRGWSISAFREREKESLSVSRHIVGNEKRQVEQLSRLSELECLVRLYAHGQHLKRGRGVIQLLAVGAPVRLDTVGTFGEKVVQYTSELNEEQS